MASDPKVARNLRGASAEVRQRFDNQFEQRQRASNILSPDEVAGSYDAGRLLATTLGGEVRALTAADLQTFKRQAEALGKKFRGGITAKAVIDNSTQADRERSNREIRVAIPYQRMGSNVHFITNAGPRSEVVRHHVHVQLLNIDAAVASPAKASDLVRMVVDGGLKFDCDCEHHQYRFRYIASIGRYNAGRTETGYPKITNPNLIGIACKHVLRVMQKMSAPDVRQYIEKMIQDGRKMERPKVVRTLKKDAAEMARLQEKQAGWKRNQVESAGEKRLRLAQQREVRRVADAAKGKIAKVAKVKPETIAVERRKFEQAARRLAQMGGISQKMLADMLAKLKGK